MGSPSLHSPDHLPPGPFEFLPEQWERAKHQARSILVEVAQRPDRKPISYSDLADRIHEIKFAPRDIRFFSLLGEISIDEDREGRPLLSALVVHKDDWKPGNGFFLLARQLGRNVSNQDSFWLAELGRIHSQWGQSRQVLGAV